MLWLRPGDPAAIIAVDYANPKDVVQIRQKLGLDIDGDSGDLTRHCLDGADACQRPQCHSRPDHPTNSTRRSSSPGARLELARTALRRGHAGTPPNLPSWGNIMAEGRSYLQLAFWIIFFPGLFVALTVLAINLVGDGLRDTLDPKLARRM